MSQPENNRVLGRKGARELAVSELEAVGGALAFNTLNCTGPGPLAARVTHTGDGDACLDTDQA